MGGKLKPTSGKLAASICMGEERFYGLAMGNLHM